MTTKPQQTRSPLPQALRRPPGSAPEARRLKVLLRRAQLSTVCEEARCPNIAECFGRGTLTFLILGDVCTRGCRFCSVDRGRKCLPPDIKGEAARVAEAAAVLNLRHIVITSVTRDDLEDGGAAAFAAAAQAVLRKLPGSAVELLIPDMQGRETALKTAASSGAAVLGHNLETVPRLYSTLRPQADYRRSLHVLKTLKQLSPSCTVKTGIMLGLGEREEEVFALMEQARSAGVDIFTAGQYMQPNRASAPVAEYIGPEGFEAYRGKARELGFMHWFIGPLVRSSYHADHYSEGAAADCGDIVKDQVLSG